MAESGEQVGVTEEVDDDLDEGHTLNYKAPEQKSMQEILDTDQEDESLQNYKKQLMGKAAEKGGAIVVDENNPNKVIVRRLEVHFEDGVTAPQSMDLSGDLSKLKDSVFMIPEGCQYRIVFVFHVQREIVQGLKYYQHTKKKLLAGATKTVDKMQHMVGSYAPSLDEVSFQTPIEDAPSGMIARGEYIIKSWFTDDDKHEYVKYEWKLKITQKQK